MGRQRTSHDRLVSGVLIVILAALIFFAPSYGWTVRAWLSPSPSGPGGISSASSPSATEDQTLIAQNESLQAQLATLQVVQSELPTSTPNEIRAMVYSRYPMSFRDELLVNVGSNQGVTVGAAVVFQGVLLGTVRTVFSNEALVQTIFDNYLKMPVRIGATGADGLLQGGSYPTVESIASTARIAPGEIVYSAAAGIPYGEPIAQIVATGTSPDSLFQQAVISFPYDINTIQTVFILQ